MMKTWSPIAVAPIAVAVAALLPTATLAETLSTEEVLRASLEPGERLQIDVPVGQIDVRAVDGVGGAVLRVHRRVQDAQDTEEARRTLEGIRVELEETRDGARLRVRGPHWLSVDGEGVEVRVEADVPAGIDLDLEIDVGEIAVTGVDGRIEARADVGGIEVREAAGSLDLQTRVGRIDAELVRHDGRDLSFETDIGEIDLTLPAALRARLDAAVDLGGIDCDFDVAGSVRTGLGARLSGDIGGGDTGGGGADLEVRTHVGMVHIRVAGDR